MRASSILLLWAVGCYRPTVPVGVACAPEGGAARCPAGQVCVFRGGAEVCAPEGSSSDLDSGVDAPDSPVDGPAIDGPLLDAPLGWWNLAWTHRRPIDITAGVNGAPAGYSISIVLDHAALVGSSASLASGDDVRIVRDGGLEVDRVLDSGSTWNAAGTTVWFKTATALAANGTARYWVYYGNPAVGSPPANASAVFLFSDGFEGNLAAWSVDPGVVLSTARAHRGTHSVAAPSTNMADVGANVAALDEMNLVWDVWWNIDDLSNADMAQYVRGNNSSVYFANLQVPSGGGPSTWDIAKVVSGTYSEVIPPPAGAATPPADTWFRVTVYAYADKMAVDVGGARSVPTSGFSTIGAMTTGGIGFGNWVSAAQVWFDDASARRFVLPEPAVVLGAPQDWP